VKRFSHKTGGPPFFDSPLVFIQYIRSFTPYLETDAGIATFLQQGVHLTWAHIIYF